jgi:hypothetical protein
MDLLGGQRGRGADPRAVKLRRQLRSDTARTEPDRGARWTSNASNKNWPTARSRYPIVKGFANTKYYQEILEECGSYQAWAATSRK